MMTDTEHDLVDGSHITRTRDIFCKMDTNNDGVLTRDEFIKGCLSDETLYKVLSCASENGDTWSTEYGNF